MRFGFIRNQKLRENTIKIVEVTSTAMSEIFSMELPPQSGSHFNVTAAHCLLSSDGKMLVILQGDRLSAYSVD